ELGLVPALVLRQFHVHEVETEERMVGVLDAPVHVNAAGAAGMALNRRAGVDHAELLPVGAHADIVLWHHGHHGEHGAGRLPAPSAAARVVVRDVALDADCDRIRGTETAERAALEFLVARLDALVDGRVQFNGHESSPLESDY